jgi:hypothetical protein
VRNGRLPFYRSPKSVESIGRIVDAEVIGLVMGTDAMNKANASVPAATVLVAGF